MGEQEEDQQIHPRFACWVRFTDHLKKHLLRGLIYTAKLSARRPVYTVAICIFIALFFPIVGIFTNFRIENDGTILWTPTGCTSQIHGDWIASEESGFPQRGRSMQVIVHANGANVLGLDGANRIFDVVDTIRATPGYNDLCSLGRGNVDGECPINSATGFWAGHNRSIFEEEVDSDEDVIFSMSHLRFANDEPVVRISIFGQPQPILGQSASALVGSNVSDVLLDSVTAYLVTISLPPEAEQALPYELEVTNRLFDLSEKWASTPGNEYVLELTTDRSFDDELNRGIRDDIPLMATAFVLMGVFCSITLARYHRIRSQSLVGVGAIVTILLAILTGYGLMFCAGVPFSSLTQIFPYVMVGIGLDDTFIITGAFARTDPKTDIVDRIEVVMREIGVSIFVSTLTTFFAFMLGGLAALPGIRWFAFYAGPTVMIDFIYQITFFIALLAIDDRRQKASRRDCCPCCATRPIDESEEEEAARVAETRVPFTTKLVESYAEILMKPVSKVVVLLTFAGLLVLGALAASKQTQEFDFRVLVPPDSFVRDYFSALGLYFDGTAVDSSFESACYFRDIDVSEEDNQEAMFSFVDDMVDLEYINKQPTSFWLRDFLFYVNGTNEIQNLTFFDQLDIFLSTEPYDVLYKNDVIRSADKYVTASRVFIVYDNVPAYDNEVQIDVLKAEQDVAQSQPLNSGKGAGDWPFFSFGGIYYAWELYAVIVQEILFTVIVGLVAVFVIALVFIPHPFGAFLVTPIVAMIYVELLGVLQIAGLRINSVSAVGLTMSIGLVVDYNMHIVLTYFEINDAATREERVKKVLNTMGKSILLGGFSTFLGVLPLSFSGSEVFRTFFVTFLGIVFLGAGHGLIFTPVVLSLIAPHTPPVEQADETEEFVSDVLAALPSGGEGGKNQLFKKTLDRSNVTMTESDSEVAFSADQPSTL
jgi:Niemann-Pick C1 protein